MCGRDTTGTRFPLQPTPEEVAQRWHALPGCYSLTCVSGGVARCGLNHRLGLSQAYGLLLRPETPEEINDDEGHGKNKCATEEIQRV